MAGNNYYRQRKRPGEQAGTNVSKNQSLIIIGRRGWALELKTLEIRLRDPKTGKWSKIVQAIKNDGYDHQSLNGDLGMKCRQNAEDGGDDACA